MSLRQTVGGGGPDVVTLPIHIAVHYIGCAAPVDGGVRVPSRAGLYLETLTRSVRQVTVAAYDPPPSPAFEDSVEYEVRAPNISFVSLGPKGTWREYRARRRRVAEIVGDVSASWDVLLFYFLPNRRARLVYAPNRCPRIVSFVVGTTATGDLPDTTSLMRRAVIALSRYWTSRQQRAVVRRSGLVVVNADELRQSLPREAKNVRTVTLAARRHDHAFRADDRFSRDEIDLMIAGRVTLEKGVLDAVEALASLRTRLPGVRLHVAGDGPAADEMLARADALGVRELMVVHGWVPAGDRLFALLKTMDVLLMPSYAEYEGFPQVIWEAMAHSVPVVSTPVRGPRESLTHERELLFVPMRDPAALADAVYRYASEPHLRRAIIARAFELASSASIEHTVGGTLEGIAATWPALQS